MSRYRKVEVSMWGDRKFRELPQEAKLLWVYLLTGPQTTTLPGLLRAGRALMADDLDMTATQIDAALAELVGHGMARVDAAARLVWLPKAMKHNPPANPNIAVHWRKEFDALPECALKAEAEQAICEFLNALDVGSPADFVMAFTTGRNTRKGVSANGIEMVTETVSETVSEISSSNRSSISISKDQGSHANEANAKGGPLPKEWQPGRLDWGITLDRWTEAGMPKSMLSDLVERFRDDPAHQTPRVSWEAQWHSWVANLIRESKSAMQSGFFRAH